MAHDASPTETESGREMDREKERERERERGEERGRERERGKERKREAEGGDLPARAVQTLRRRPWCKMKHPPWGSKPRPQG